jgi:hypothetical protein
VSPMFPFICKGFTVVSLIGLLWTAVKKMVLKISMSAFFINLSDCRVMKIRVKTHDEH